jgi:hypothetical protein
MSHFSGKSFVLEREMREFREIPFIILPDFPDFPHENKTFSETGTRNYGKI